MEEAQDEFDWQPPDDVYAVQLCEHFLAMCRDNRKQIAFLKGRCWTAGAASFLYSIQTQSEPIGVAELQATVETNHAMFERLSPLSPSKFYIGYELILERARALRKYDGWDKRGLRTAYGHLQICLSSQGWLLNWSEWAADEFKSGEDFYGSTRKEFSWLRVLFCIPKKNV